MVQFNPDKNKQAVQVIFSCEKYKPIHPSLIFNQSEVIEKDEHTHLGMILDSKLNFNSHIKEAIFKARRGIGIIRYLFKYVSGDVFNQRTCEANPAGENSLFIFTVCVKSVPLYNFKLCYVVLHRAV